MFARLVASVKGLLRRRTISSEVDEELQFHLDMETQANIEHGMSPAEARRVALRDLGGVTQTREAVAEVRTTIFDAIQQDVRFAIRGCRRNPGFAFVAIAVLALGIAANTVIFSLANAVLFRPLAVPDASHLQFFAVTFEHHQNSFDGIPYDAFQDLAGRRDIFSAVAGYRDDSTKIGKGIGAALVRGERVTTNYFDVLYLNAALGRTFVAADDLPDAAPVVVLSDRFWRQRFRADRHVIGATVDFRERTSDDHAFLHHRVYTVIGVMPPRFNGLSSAWVPAEYWVPLRQRTSDLREGDVKAERNHLSVAERLNGSGSPMIVARLQPGVSAGALRAVMLAAERAMPEVRWATSKGTRLEKRVVVRAETDGGRLPFDPAGRVVPARLALALMIVSCLVLLIAATNLAGLLLARGVSRGSEIGVRLALGAGRSRVARHLLAECLLLALAGAAAGLGLSRVFIALFQAFLPDRMAVGPSSITSLALEVPLDLRVLIFTAVLGIAAGVLVSLMPVLQAVRTDVLGALAGGAHAPAATARSRVRRWIVVPQIALSLVLLLGAGVLVRSLLRAELADRGFDANGVFYANVAMPWSYSGSMSDEQRAAEDARRVAVYHELLARARAIPGVEHAALGTRGWDSLDRAAVGTRQDDSGGRSRDIHIARVSAEYFETLSIHLLRGRAFDARDAAASAPVAIVCERLAERLWPGQDPIGRYLTESAGGRSHATSRQVVGVANEAKVPGGEEAISPFLYVPLEQQRRMVTPSLFVRASARDPHEMMKALSATILAVRPEAEVRQARSMNEDIDQMLYPRRVGVAILTLSGLFGLLLSTVGLYGVVSYSASHRLREIGIRAALGAARGHIVRLLVRDALVALGIGIGCGVALGYTALRLVSSVLVAIPALDTFTLVAVPAILSAVTLAACLLPARRAARVSPVEILRAQ